MTFKYDVDNLEDAINDLYTNNNEYDFAFDGWKDSSSWGEGCFEGIVGNYSEFIDVGVPSRFYITFKGNYKFKVSIEDFTAGTGTTGLKIYKNNVEIYNYQGNSNNKFAKFSHRTDDIIIEVEEGDVLHANMYGSGSRTFFLTRFKKIN